MEVDKTEVDEVFDIAEKCACFSGTIGFSLPGLAGTEERSWLLYGGSGVRRFGSTSGRPPTAPSKQDHSVVHIQFKIQTFTTNLM